MDSGACLIESGLNVNIKRTDGRVHSALVSGVNYEQRTVTVEWFEKGETKGKEVEIDVILSLNPELQPQKDNRQQQQQHHLPPPDTNRILRNPTRQSIPVPNKGNAIKRETHRARPTNIMPPPSSNGLGAGSKTGAGGAGGGPLSHNNHHANNVQNSKQAELEQLSENMPPPHHNRQLPARSQTSSNVPQQIANNIGGSSNASRRSNVVKEVEKLKENREKRRQRQAELKEEKEALMNMDPGNPNWEFSAMIKHYQNTIAFRPLRDSDPVEDHQITVCVRKRPLNRKETNKKEIDVISVPSKDQMIVHEPKSKVDLTKFLENQHFRFDYAFDESCSNEIVYKYTAKPLVKTIFEGGMATCFAYGQTGSGKTHTMGGDFNGRTQDCKKGIYAMAAKDVFKTLRSPKYRPLGLIVSASFFEIYSGKVFDLLNDKAKLRVLEDGKQQVQIVGLTEKIVEDCDEVLKLIQHGNNARTSGQTSANTNSSRSHAVFQIIVRSPGLNRIHGKFSLIDLAGNERGADTSSANRQTRMEGAEINKSLLALKECIRALGKRGAHLPFRASKLTQVLRDSFIGDKSRTCMIAMISPGMSSCEHSLNTLRYADRVKELAASDPTGMSRNSPTNNKGKGSRMAIDGEDEEANGDEGNDAMEDDQLRDEDYALMMNQGGSSDLAQLRSLNEGDMSADMLSFHEAVAGVQRAEEELLDDHRALNERLLEFHALSADLYAVANRDVDYDQDAYALRFEALLSELAGSIGHSRALLADFRAKLRAEEVMSAMMANAVHQRRGGGA
ncbi:kinesin-like protein Klp10A [Ctenocephalides felis]|uniref:kinesin-like protein Klp10A n=1 Tax=Ctenocephalides felis TaxID=7515 RepID=UPI000E6E52A7|nr:kinesin-like protein Klp10A [Ctenocephalides felis]